MTCELTRLRQLAGVVTEAPMTDDGQYVRYAKFIQQTVRDALQKLPAADIEMLMSSLADDIQFIRMHLEKKGVTPGFHIEITQATEAGLPDKYNQPSPLDRRQRG